MLRIIVALVAIAMLRGTVSAQTAETVPEAEETEEAATEPEPPPESPDEVEARTRFNLGQQLYEQGRFEEALDQFRSAHELSGRPGLLYNIYLCHRDAGNTREAASSLRAYLDAEPETNNRAMLERRLTTLEEQAAREDDAARRATEAEQTRRGT